jgi:hypothetical protein
MLLHAPASFPAANATAAVNGLLSNGTADGVASLAASLAKTAEQASNGTAGGAGARGEPTPQITLLAGWISRIVEQLEVHFEGPDLADWVCLVVGYCIVAGLVLLGLWGFLMWKVLAI